MQLLTTGGEVKIVWEIKNRIRSQYPKPSGSYPNSYVDTCTARQAPLWIWNKVDWRIIKPSELRLISSISIDTKDRLVHSYRRLYERQNLRHRVRLAGGREWTDLGLGMCWPLRAADLAKIVSFDCQAAHRNLKLYLIFLCYKCMYPPTQAPMQKTRTRNRKIQVRPKLRNKAKLSHPLFKRPTPNMSSMPLTHIHIDFHRMTS